MLDFAGMSTNASGQEVLLLQEAGLPRPLLPGQIAPRVKQERDAGAKRVRA